MAIFLNVQATDEVIDAQANATGIPSFLNNSKQYISQSFPDIDLNNMLENSITGKLNLTGIWKSIVGLFGDELLTRNF